MPAFMTPVRVELGTTATAVAVRVTGDANPRFEVSAGGMAKFGDGTATTPVSIVYDSVAGGLLVSTTNSTGNTAALNIVKTSNDNAANNLHLSKSRALGALASGDSLGGLCWMGHDGVGYQKTSSIVMSALEAFTPSARGAAMRFLATTVGTTAATERMRLINDTLAIGTVITTTGAVEKLRVNAVTTVDALAAAQLASGATTTKPLVVQGAASQTANLTEWQSSAGSPVLSVTKDGYLDSGDLRMLSSGSQVLRALNYPAWIDSTFSGFFQVGTSGGAGIFTSALGTQFSRFGITSGGTAISDIFYSSLPVPVGVLDVTADTNKIGLIVKGGSTQALDLQQWRNSAGTVLASMNSAGSLVVGDISASPAADFKVQLGAGRATAAPLDLDGTATVARYAAGGAVFSRTRAVALGAGGASNSSFGQWVDVTHDLNGQTYTNAVSGISAQATVAGAGTASGGTGIFSSVSNAGTATVTTATALVAQVAQANAAGSITTGMGLHVAAASKGAAGTIGTLYGVRVRAQTVGTASYGIAVAAAGTQTLWVDAEADNTTSNAGIAFGLSRDTNLYRSAADTLRTDDSLVVGGALTVTGTLNASIANTPAGTIAATTVQAALNELDTEKAPLDAPVFTTSAQAPKRGGGAATPADRLFYVGGNHAAGATTQRSAEITGAFASTTTGVGRALQVAAATAAASFTVASLAGIFVGTPSLGAGSAATTVYGIQIQASVIGATAYGIQVNAQQGSTAGFGIAIGAASTATLWLGHTADATVAAAGIAFGLSRDTNLYRSAADTLKTDDNLVVLGTLTAGGVVGNMPFVSTMKWGVD